jgi:hypothetical protein
MSATKLLDYLGEGHQRVANADDRATVYRHIPWDNSSGGPTQMPCVQVLLVFDERNVARLCLGEGAGIRDGQVGVAQDFAPHPLGQGPDGDGHGGPHFPCKSQNPIAEFAKGNGIRRPLARSTDWVVSQGISAK